jgi:tRNA uridine 5-carboxymethylaminomethyl modification enzyme
MSLQNIANVLQSCHGRNCKGQIVREIDALGGYSGIVSDRTAIQFKMLNKSKGPAMVAKSSKRPYAFAEEWRLMLEGTPNQILPRDGE